jgi:putative tricarboxylic transport membrane protein
VAPPGITADERARLAAAVDAMVRSAEWRELLARFRWLDRYLAGDEFAAFAVAEEQRVRAVLRELGTGAAPAGRALGAYPVVVLVGLAIFGTAALVTHRRAPSPAGAEVPPHWRSLLSIAAGAASLLVLVEPLGFIVAAAVLFWLVARAFDARHAVRDGVAAVGVATAAYLLFSYALDLPLPAGVLGRWL